MKKSEIRDIVITGSYMIGEDGIIEPVHGWKWYAEKLEDILVQYNGSLPNANNLDESDSLHLPTKEEITKILYKCARIEKTDEGIKMERLFEKEAEAILSLITGNDR